MARRRRMRANLGSSVEVHAEEAQRQFESAQNAARAAVKHARAGRCGTAFSLYYAAQQSFGRGMAEYGHSGGRTNRVGGGQVQRWLTAATKAFRSRCVVKR